MDADTELDAPFRGQSPVPFDHAVLNLKRATDGIDYAAELDNGAVARAFHNAAAMQGHSWVN
jgi:hypothetical protein